MTALPSFASENLLVGTANYDDAGVYRLTDDLALVQTVDFFTPIVDNPYFFGQIAAANALSDIYAMGAKPLTALNITCFSFTRIGAKAKDVLQEILRGGAVKIKEAGAILIGGHTVEDNEPKYGLAVTGIIHPAQVITNAAAKAGDILILTKPLGTGIIATAIKAEFAEQEAIAEAIKWMVFLNEKASLAMREVKTHAATDITGFGFLGHALEMAKASRVGLEIFASALPLLPTVLDLADQGMRPAGLMHNQRYVGNWTEIEEGISPALKDLLFDPQTSGGLLIAVEPEDKDKLIKLLLASGNKAEVVGKVVAEHPGFIKVFNK